MKVREKYPLDAAEEHAIVANLLGSECLLLVLAIVGIGVIEGITTGNWTWAFLEGGWANVIAKSVLRQSVVGTASAALVLSGVLLVLSYGTEWIALRTKAGRAAVMRTRQGVTGEMPRMRMAPMPLYMLLAGCAEELLFRFVLVEGLAQVLLRFMPVLYAALIALVVSSFAFWLAHVQYRDFYSSALILVISLLMGVAFLATGSIMVVALAHAVYDFVQVLVERWRMLRNDDYFGGKVPNDEMLQMMQGVINAHKND